MSRKTITGILEPLVFSLEESMSQQTKYETVIGLEVHCQLSTESKLFCSCPTNFGADVNKNTCPVCLGYPGALPVFNEKVIEYAVLFALGVGAEIKPKSYFARKQYFYPDLPKGYQITQFDKPYCEGGGILLSSGKKINLIRAHIEEDAGKSIHAEEYSYIDLNRAGIPLLEIVSEPELRTAAEASEYLKKLRMLVKYLGISDANLEEGSFRCDANISLRKHGDLEYGTRCEVKNLNSYRHIEQAIHYEVLRQSDLLDNGEKVVQQTLLFEESSGKTKPMRGKEDAHDYRYFSDPDLKAIVVSSDLVLQVKARMPKLPDQVYQHFTGNLGLTHQDATVLSSDKNVANFYEQLLTNLDSKLNEKQIANWLIETYLPASQQFSWDLAKPEISIDAFTSLLVMFSEGSISSTAAKKVFLYMIETKKTAKECVTELGLDQVNDKSVIVETVRKVLADNALQVEELKSGKQKVYGYLVGQVMKSSKGKFNPKLVNQLLQELLDEYK